MYYELYVDVLFCVNFMMDYLLLLIVQKMLKCSATHGSICLGAMIGSLLTCIVIVCPIPYAFVKVLLFHVVVNTCMIRVGLKIRNIRSFVKAIMMLYIGAFLLGGVLGTLQPYIRIGSLFLVVAIAGYYLVLGIWKFVTYVQRWNQCHCEVELHFGGEICRVKGLMDTGNGLMDPVSGSPVSVLDKRTANKLLGNETKNFRYISYRTIGKEHGLMPVVRIDGIRVCGEKECWIERPLIGISEKEIGSEEEYEMILNPNLF